MKFSWESQSRFFFCASCLKNQLKRERMKFDGFLAKLSLLFLSAVIVDRTTCRVVDGSVTATLIFRFGGFVTR